MLRDPARQKECNVEEGQLLADHAHMLLPVPPKYAAARVIGVPKGKSATHIARQLSRPAAALHGPTLLGAGLLRLD
jgi:putative transposase